MAKVYELVKNQRIVSVTPDMSVMQAARLMTEKHIGAVVVMSDGQLVGIFSERDVMSRVVALGRSPGHTMISEVMTARPYTVSAEEEVEKCMFPMREYNFRHLPVIEKGTGMVVGLLSLRDLLWNEVSEREERARRAAI